MYHKYIMNLTKNNVYNLQRTCVHTHIMFNVFSNNLNINSLIMTASNIFLPTLEFVSESSVQFTTYRCHEKCSKESTSNN